MTPPRAAITTSWDDGHPLDLRLATMLVEHGLTGTFYVPKRWARPTMTDVQLRELVDAGFELGGHTLDHVVLTQTPDDEAASQISASRDWLCDVTGNDCTMFCPPTGRFAPQHAEMIRRAGYHGFRTVELWSTDKPRVFSHGLVEMPTSLQAQPHGRLPILRNIAKRRRIPNLTRFLRMGRSGDWLEQLGRLANHTQAHGGVLHLWGHSWEVEAFKQWDRLDAAFALLGSLTPDMPALTNGEVCRRLGPNARSESNG
ncbi:MAG: polysaccharide deacetylase family protein [Phycisphaerales bacterium JB063]